jgi:hypothetical protein
MRGSAVSISLILPLQPNHTSVRFLSAAFTDATTSPPAICLFPGSGTATRFDTMIKRGLAASENGLKHLPRLVVPPDGQMSEQMPLP